MFKAMLPTVIGSTLLGQASGGRKSLRVWAEKLPSGPGIVFRASGSNSSGRFLARAGDSSFYFDKLEKGRYHLESFLAELFLLKKSIL